MKCSPGRSRFLLVVIVTLAGWNLSVAPAAARVWNPVTVSVRSTPSAVRITGTVSTRVTMTHVVTVGEPVAEFVEPGAAGTFFGADAIYGTVTTVPVRVALTADTATFQETITVDSAAIQAALADGSSWFTYERPFTVNPASGYSGAAVNVVTAQLSFQSQTVGSLGVRRMDLYFEEGSVRVTETTVPRGAQGLVARAEVEVDGSGYLEGQWLVDGRVIERVRQYTSYGQKVTLSTSTIPGISTFSPGLHTVKLQITDPVPPFEEPRIVYLVTEKEEGAIAPIAVKGPAEGASVTPETRFAWTATPRAVVYIATWWRAFDSRKVLSAMVQEGSYQAPEALFGEKFVPGVKYTWQVKGYDGDGRLMSSGPVGSFMAR